MLRCYTNDVETVIAKSVDHAKQLLMDLCGYGEEDLEYDEWDVRGGIDPQETISIRYDLWDHYLAVEEGKLPKGAKVTIHNPVLMQGGPRGKFVLHNGTLMVEATVEAWIEHCGEGVLCSTEW